MKTVYCVKAPNGLYRISVTPKSTRRLALEPLPDRHEWVGAKSFDDGDNVLKMIAARYAKRIVHKKMYRLSTEEVDEITRFLTDGSDFSPQSTPPAIATSLNDDEKRLIDQPLFGDNFGRAS